MLMLKMAGLWILVSIEVFISMVSILDFIKKRVSNSNCKTAKQRVKYSLSYGGLRHRYWERQKLEMQLNYVFSTIHKLGSGFLRTYLTKIWRNLPSIKP